MQATAPQTPSSANTGALAGIKVLDLSRVLAGPWCTQTLGDMGADVIKIERPGAGDDTRMWGPPFLHDSDGNDTPQAAYYACCNRNKRSMTVDMAMPEGKALLQRMAAESDVVVENFKVGGLKAYGLDYESLKAINPRLIYCSITGFGQTGPYAPRAGYDLMMQAMSGMMSVTGRPDGEPGAGPLRVGVALTDVFTGLYASTAILAALHVRSTTGLGQHIDMALLDVGIAILANQTTGYLNTGIVPQRQGNTHPSLSPYQDFETADGSMLLAIGNDGQFARFANAAGKPEWAQDARYATTTARVQNRGTLIPAMQEVTRTRTTPDWVALLGQCAVPCGPINDIGQAFAEPQVQARQLKVTLPRHADDGITEISGVASPLRLSANPAVYRYAPPALGQDTDDVLQEMGFNKADIAKMRASGVV